MKLGNDSLTLYAVTDRAWLNGRSLIECVDEAIQGGVTMVQLREKHMNFDQFVKLAKELKPICQHYQVPFIINDNLRVAKACDADGIHIGQNDQRLPEIIESWSEDKIYGVSAQTVQQARVAQQQGATYLGVGAMFSTTTKDDAEKVSIKELVEIVKAVDIPVCAIGGINKTNINELYDSGISGVALVSEIFNKANIHFNTKELVKLVAPFKQGA